jgi:hypothetical protein
MTYIKLDDVLEEHLLGTWKVKSRLVNKNTMGNVFANSDCLKFIKESTCTITTDSGKMNKGHWEMIREREMIYNPQVKFHLAKKVIVNSIITTLQTDDNIHYKLILYFDSGLELVLEKTVE